MVKYIQSTISEVYTLRLNGVETLIEPLKDFDDGDKGGYNFLDTRDLLTDEGYPCDTCDLHCDYWEAKYCCTLCHWYDDNPDCEDCNPWDI